MCNDDGTGSLNLKVTFSSFVHIKFLISALLFGPKTVERLLSLFTNRTWRFNTATTKATVNYMILSHMNPGSKPVLLSVFKVAVFQVFPAYNLCKFFVSVSAYQLTRADYPDKIPNGATAPLFGPKIGKHLLSLFSNRTWRFNTTKTKVTVNIHDPQPGEPRFTAYLLFQSSQWLFSKRSLYLHSVQIICFPISK